MITTDTSSQIAFEIVPDTERSLTAAAWGITTAIAAGLAVAASVGASNVSPTYGSAASAPGNVIGQLAFMAVGAFLMTLVAICAGVARIGVLRLEGRRTGAAILLLMAQVLVMLPVVTLASFATLAVMSNPA